MSDEKQTRWSPTGEDAIEYNRCLRAAAEKRTDLRDYFAGQALARMERGVFGGNEQSMACCAYSTADAMLAERNKGEG